MRVQNDNFAFSIFFPGGATAPSCPPHKCRLSKLMMLVKYFYKKNKLQLNILICIFFKLLFTFCHYCDKTYSFSIN